MKRLPITLLTACCIVFFGSAPLFAAPPDWKNGVVRELDSNYAHVTVADNNGDPGLSGHGAIKQYCTIEAGTTLLIAEREISGRGEHAMLREDRGIHYKIVGQTLVVKDNAGNQTSFRLLKSMPETADNRPDRTAFAERALVIQ